MSDETQDETEETADEILFIVREDDEAGFIAESADGRVADALTRELLGPAVRKTLDDWPADKPRPAWIRLRYIDETLVPVEPAPSSACRFPLPGPYRFEDSLSPLAVDVSGGGGVT